MQQGRIATAHYCPDACPCGNPLPAIRVEGRTDEILRMVGANGEVVPVLPLALWAVIKQCQGVQRFQVILTNLTTLRIRLETYADGDRQETWNLVQANVSQFLASQGVDNARVILAEEMPMRDPRSGKFRHVLSMIKGNGE